jgi:opacity protein-like surface antigen
MYRARTTVDQQGPGVVTPHAAGTNSGFTYGAGVGYNLWKLGLRAEWQRYDSVGTGDTGEDTIDVFSVGAIVRF